jgi:CarD family transcriptional regulator
MREGQVFNVGDKLVHPAYGAGTIVDIQDKQIGDEQRTYYIIELLSQAGTLMVPVTRASAVGLRPPIKKPNRVLQVLASEPLLLSDDHRERQELIGGDIRSGNVLKISEAVRDLAYRDKAGRLTEADLRLYRKAQEFLVGELALSQDIDVETARDQVGSTLSAMNT